MSPEKKVLLLFLSLIILIVACVYSHLPSLMKDTPTSEVVVEVQESKSEKTDDNLVEVKEAMQENKDNEVLAEDTQINDEINKENSDDLEVKATTEENIKEEVEEIIKEEPLIITDKRYLREDSEKYIEDLSKASQELQIRINEYIKKNQVTFKRASYKLTKASNKTIKMIVEILKENPSIKIEVAGHTDAVGARNVNQSISQARAKSVEAVLIKNGIDKDRIIARGYGEDIPMVKNSPKGYSKINRRVEFNIIEE